MSSYKIFKYILENKEVSYDIYITLPVKDSCDFIRKKIKDKLENRAFDVFATNYNNKIHVYVNLDLKYAYNHDNGYEEIMCHVLPYILIYESLKNDFTFDDFVFNELLLEKREYSKDYKSYNEIINSINKTKTPITIVNNEMIGSYETETVIYPEIYEIELKIDDKKIWPSTYEERKITKALYYTLLYSKNKYKYRISEDWMILKYKTNYYKITAKLNDDNKSNEQIITRQLQKLIKTKSDIFKYNIMSVKQYLSAHGFYPLIYNELYVNLVCCMLQKEDVSPGAFFKLFLDFDFVKNNNTYNIETNKLEKNNENEFVVKSSQCCYIMPKIDDTFAERLSMLNKKLNTKKFALFDANFDLLTKKLLVPCLNDFDFILSKNLILGFENISNKQTNDFLLGKPLFEGYNSILGDLSNYAYFFYSPDFEMLYVKQKTDFDKNLLISVILSRTSFEYIKITQNK
ncbi:hypothetical protein BDAP_001077 [Binucleata daphniae]